MRESFNCLYAAAKKQLPRALITACLAGAPWAAWSLEFGALRWKMVTNQLAHVEVELHEKFPLDPGAIRAIIAPRETYATAGLAYDPSLKSIQINTLSGPYGRVVLVMESPLSNMPAVDFLIIVRAGAAQSVVNYRVDFQMGSHEVMPSPMHARLAMDSRVVVPAPSPGPAPSPIPAPVAPPSSSLADPLADARSAVMAWASAWSRRDVDAYIGTYTPDYAGGQPSTERKNWVDQRKARIAARKKISVEVSDLQLERQGDTVVATFEQRYRSEGPGDRLRKTLVLVQLKGRWLIQRESNTN